MVDLYKISVIVPFFNVEKSLFLRCIESILKQSYENLEIIIVNDGSDPKYNDLLNSVQKRDSRIILINQVNQGVSVARNTGVKISKGDFIAFVDADDYLDYRYLEEALLVQKKYSADFVIGGVMSVPENGSVLCQKSCAEQNIDDQIGNVQVYDSNSFDKIIPSLISSKSIIRFSDEGYINRGPVARLLKKEIAQKISFPEGIPLGEDIIWNQYVLHECKRIVIVHKVWYYYVRNYSSISHIYKKNAIENIRLMGNALFKSINTLNDEIYLAFCNKLLGDTRWHVCRSCLTNKENKDGFWRNLKKYSNLKTEAPWNHVTWRFAKTGNFHEKLELLLFWSNIYFIAAYIKDHLKR